MSNLELPPDAARWANDLLVWVGFGTLVGLVAKAVMPGRDPGGALTTLLMGITGTVIGCGSLAFFTQSRQQITPISPVGFVVATIGAFVLLLFYRMFAGYYFDDGMMPPPRRYAASRRPAPRRRRRYDYDYPPAYDD